MRAPPDMNSPDARPPFDLSRFTQWAGGDNEQIRHIGGIFCETLTVALLKFRVALDVADIEAVRCLAHDIKNCFILVSARQAAASAEVFEDLIGVDDEGVALAEAQRLEAWAHRVLDAVRTHIGDAR